MFFLAVISNSEKSVESCVDSLGKLFAIVLALAISEAFKQFVSDKAEPGKRKIHLDRLWALVGFMCLVVPFFHGMSRYFFDTYQTPHRPEPYSFYLAIDTFAFTIEAVLFFVLSRSLDPTEWRRFYFTVVVLLATDIVWGSWVAWKINGSVWRWVAVNGGALPVLGLFLCCGSRSTSPRQTPQRELGADAGPDSLPARKVKSTLNVTAAIGMAILFFRMLVDYSVSFKFYFPVEPTIAALVAPGADTMSKPVVYIASPYSKGDAAMNTHFQCKVFDQMLTDGKVWPVAPLWSHFQHTLFPRRYDDWIAYDQALIPRYDACLRLTAKLDSPAYIQAESSGADAEVRAFKSLGKPVFENLADLYAWADRLQKGT